jgi:hypothetical protein
VFHFGEERFAVEIKLDTANLSDPFVELTHRTRDEREGDRTVRDRLRLISTVPMYDGRRWWFQCPRTYRKTTKLYLPNGDGISGAAKPMASDMPASARIASAVFSDEQPSERAEVDALANLRPEIRALEASSREGQRGVRDPIDPTLAPTPCVAPGQSITRP